MATKIERLTAELKNARKELRAATKAYDEAKTGRRALKAEMKEWEEYVEETAEALKEAKAKAKAAAKRKAAEKKPAKKVVKKVVKAKKIDPATLPIGPVDFKTAKALCPELAADPEDYFNKDFYNNAKKGDRVLTYDQMQFKVCVVTMRKRHHVEDIIRIRDNQQSWRSRSNAIIIG